MAHLRRIPVHFWSISDRFCIPFVILARFLGLKAGAISVITNMGAGMSDESISHEHTKAMAPLGAAKLAKVLTRYLAGKSQP